jgi:HEAT repeat protein
MLDKLASLLHADRMESRIAAAIVLGALKIRAPEAVDALLATLRDSVDAPSLQRHVLEALAQTTPARALNAVLGCLESSSAEVRTAAQDFQ